jgi:hypothetical protein
MFELVSRGTICSLKNYEHCSIILSYLIYEKIIFDYDLIDGQLVGICN